MVGPELVDPHRCTKVLEVMLTEIGQRHVDKVTRRLGQQHLAPVPGSGDARAPVDFTADVALLRPARLAGVQAHAYADRAICQS